MTDYDQIHDYWFKQRTDLSFIERQRRYNSQIKEEQELDRKYPYRGPAGQRLSYEELGLYYK